MENQRNKLWQYLQALPNKASEALLGKPVLDVDSVDLSGVDTTTPEFKENMGGVVDIKVGNNPRVGGLIPDITAGYRENSARPLEFNNLQTNITPDGRNKGAAYRFGEFAGTAARLLDNPLVRGGIAYGLSKSMGDRRPLVEGLTAAVGTQQNRMKDQMYRQALAERDIDTSGIRGWLGDDTFKYLLEDQQVRDNAAYRNAYLKAQETNQAIANQIALDRLNYTKYQDAIENAREDRKLKITEDKIKGGTQKFRTAIGDKDGALQQIQEMKKLVQANPNATGYIVGKFAKGQEAAQKFANEFISSNPEAIKTRAAIAKLRGTTMHDLAGTAQTLQEQRNLAPFLPDATDNAKTILAKLEQLEKELLREKQTLVNTGYELGFDYDNTQPAQQTTTNEGWAF
jgi:hypothetical protein